MSRLIVKNLPSEIKPEKLRGIFAAHGDITDLQLKYTRAGVFRKFAFVGFRGKSSAQNAASSLNKTFIDSSKIQVEIAKDLGDDSLARPWSKYSEKSSAFQEQGAKKERKGAGKDKEGTDEAAASKKADPPKAKPKGKGDPLRELEDDAGFQEFYEVHQARSKKPAWTNDATLADPARSEVKGKPKGHDGPTFEDATSSDEDDDPKMEVEEEEEEEEEGEEEEDTSSKQANKPGLSDMEYLRGKMVTKTGSKTADSDSDSGSDSDSDSESDSGKDSGRTSSEDGEDKSHQTGRGQAKKGTQPEVGPKAKLMKAVTKDATFERGQYVLKMRGVPFNVKETDIRRFFAPITISAIRIPLNEKKQRTGLAFVEFASESDLVLALKRNKEYMGKRYIELFRDDWNQGGAQGTRQREAPWAKQAEELEKSEEPVGETGRLFVRNLPYVCQEEDLEQLFCKYGPLTEVNLPIDPLTKKVKGFAFVTYMMPEHAVKAFTELDGKTFQGRLLHILPGKEKKVAEETAEGGATSSYKKQKKAKDKAQSGSSHNWNSLFIGSDAVAEAIAQKYQTTKGQVLDPETGRSLAVRMALGETQIVAETRQFLLDNGVALDSFSQPSGARSKTVLLAKNLPAGTQAAELRDLFASSGDLGRLLLPPAGVTALVEFVEPTEARAAFFQLAYTKFHHVPLYLEWAPVNVFKAGEASVAESAAAVPEVTAEVTRGDIHAEASPEGEGGPVVREEEKDAATQRNKEEADEEEVEPESTIFVKNLNFDTNEEELKKMFSKCGGLRNVTISRKKDTKHHGVMLSMGYGFVEYKKASSAKKALKELQHCTLEGHQLELKISHRTSSQAKQGASSRKKAGSQEQTSSKILIRNIPFEAKKQEIQELFGTFGEIKSVRLPKKMSGTGSHRGFGFVDFLSKQDAKRAFDALCHSSHLYGRRLVLEWAETEETIEDLRRKTADHFSEGGPKKRLKKSKLKEDLQLTMSIS